MPAARKAAQRSRRSAKAAGARFAGGVASFLAISLDDDRIERRAPSGSLDRGDITGVRAECGRVVIECKNEARWKPGTWLNEASRERINDGASVGVVVAKRHGFGDPGDAVVLMTLTDFAILLGAKPTRDDLAQMTLPEVAE